MKSPATAVSDASPAQHPNRKGKPRLWFADLKPDPARAEAEDDAVLARAAQILKQRLLRLGTLDQPAMAADYLKARLGPLEREAFLVLLLDNRHRILADEILFLKTVDSAEVHPREVVKLALHHNACAVICAHNHPSGNPEPSAADRAVTARLKGALALVEIRLLDHIVVGPLQHESFAARGWV